MYKKNNIFSIILLLILLSVFIVSGCSQQTIEQSNSNYPNRPVTLVNPFAPGGSHDVMARILISTMSEHLGQPMIVESKPGAGGTVGAAYVAQAKPDGYTLLLGDDLGMLWNKLLIDEVPYDIDDFIAIGRINVTPNVIAVLEKSPFKTLNDVVEEAKKNPGKVTYGHTTGLDPRRRALWQFANQEGIDLKAVPFDGVPVAMNSFLGGHIDINGGTLEVMGPMIESGQVRGLAITSSERSEALPDVPTFKELGYDIEEAMFKAVFVPKGTPEEIVSKLKEALENTVKDPTFEKMVFTTGATIDYLPGDELQNLLENDFERANELITKMIEGGIEF